MAEALGGEDRGGPRFFINVRRLPQDGMPIRFRAEPGELASLARRLGIPAVERLEADVLVTAWRGDGVKIAGRFEADVVQSCVVMLDPVRQTVDEPVDLVFVPESSKLARPPSLTDGELHLDPEGADIPETFQGERIDFGDVLAELVALGLDPYPRSAGAVFSEVDTDPDPSAGAVSPFAALGKLKGGDS